mgnify:CR=1 FL=1
MTSPTTSEESKKKGRFRLFYGYPQYIVFKLICIVNKALLVGKDIDPTLRNENILLSGNAAGYESHTPFF